MYKLKYLAFTGLLCLSACGTPYNSHGMLNFNVIWPQQPSNFEIKIIPDESSEIVFQVFDASGKKELEQSFTRQEGLQKISLSLRVGKKKLVISAKDSSGKILAESRSEVEIKAGQVSQIQRELIPLDISIVPTETFPSTGTAPSSNPSPNVKPSDKPTTGTDSLTTPEASPLPNASATPTPQATTSSSGGGGGGSGSSSSNGININANPSSLSGMGYSTLLTATLSDNNTIDNITWSCVSPPGANSCGSFSGNTSQTVWKSPNDNASFGNGDVTSVTFVITANITQNNGTNLTQTISITVKRGDGTVVIPNTPSPAGEFDGGN